MAKRRNQKKGGFTTSPPEPVVNIAQARSVRTALQPKRKPGVFIAVPTVSQKVNYSLAMTFGRSMASSMLPECPFNFSIHIENGKKCID